MSDNKAYECTCTYDGYIATLHESTCAVFLVAMFEEEKRISKALRAERDAALARVEELEKAAKHTIKKLRSHHLCRSGIGAIVAKLEEVINRR
jgi:hypothetical protein